MKAAVIVFPGSNRERDVATALFEASGKPPSFVWHRDTELPDGTDLAVLPGGFSHGDYLRAGAMAARSPILEAVRGHAARGGAVLAICNGFQIATEAGLLPGVMLRNSDLRFVCRPVGLRVERSDTPFTGRYTNGDVITVPVAHNDGAYFAGPNTLAQLEDEGRIAFRYAPPKEGKAWDGEVANPNGAVADIAGIFSENLRVLGMMPHPENAIATHHVSTGGAGLFRSIAEALA